MSTPTDYRKKWQTELKRFGENFKQLDGHTLRHCIEEYYKEEEWSTEYKKCILPYSLFDELLVYGSSNGIKRRTRQKSLMDLSYFPKFDLLIIDEAHHITNPNTYAMLRVNYSVTMQKVSFCCLLHQFSWVIEICLYC